MHTYGVYRRDFHRYNQTQLSYRPTNRIFRTFATACALFCVVALPGGLGKMPYFPVALRYILLLIASALLALDSGRRLAGSAMSLPKPFKVYLGTIIALLSLKGEFLSVVLPTEALVLYVILHFLCAASRRRAELMTLVLFGFFVSSAAWMLASTYVEEPFMSIRVFLYGSHAERFRLGLLTLHHPTGFTFNPYAMGYQLAAGTTMATVMLLSARNRFAKSVLSICLAIMAAGIVLASERSVIPSVILPLVGMAVIRRRRGLIMLLCATAATALLVIHYVECVTPEITTISDKISTTGDASARLSWQIAALKILVRNPVGNILGELDWEDEAAEEGADFSYYGVATAVHNSYLGVMLRFGWIGIAMVMWCIAFVIRRVILPFYRLPPTSTADRPSYPLATAVGLAAVMTNALFHNASIFTFEGTSWILLCLTLIWRVMLQPPCLERTNA